MPPKARICPICGRPTLLPGYAQHVVQCKDLYERREMAKPPKERRPLPASILDFSSNRSGKLGNLDDLNDAAFKSFQQTLVPCKYCGRKFISEKLAIHNRSCTAAHPAKPVSSSFPDEATPRSSDGRYREYERDNEEQHLRKSLKNFSLDESSRGSMVRTGGNSRMVSGKKVFTQEPVDFPTYAALMKCPDCGRNFNEVSFEK
jgi:ribosomal protein S27E